MFKIIVVLIILVTTWLLWPSSDDNLLHVYFLDIGQGDASLVRTPGGQNILVDGGPDNSLLYRLADIMPWTEKKIDYIIISHYHADHFLGLINLLDKYEIGRIITTAHQADNFLYAVWQDKLLTKGIEVVQVSAGDSFRIDDTNWLVLSADNDHEDYNENSLVLKFNYNDFDILFTGDLPISSEDNILAENIKSEVLKVAHHGSRYSTSNEFLRAADPELCVIQSGLDNKFGHPHQELLNRLSGTCQVEQNVEEGTISITSDGQKWWLD